MAVPQGNNGEIAVSLPNRGGDIFLVSEDGATLTNLTSSAGSESSPSWAPDGSRLVYSSREDGEFSSQADLFIIGSDGEDRRRLTGDNAGDLDPSWSPTGEWIAFKRSFTENIFRIAPDGTDLQQLTHGEGGAEQYWYPEWSPDGSQLAWTYHAGNDTVQLQTANADGSGVKTIYQRVDGQTIFHPQWSPDGQWIVFWSGLFSGEAFKIHVSGSDLTSLTPQGWSDYSVTWAPDGQSLLFESVGPSDDYTNLYIADTAGSSRTLVRDTLGTNDIGPRWQPTKPFAPARSVNDSCPSGQVPEDGFEDVPTDAPYEHAVDCVVWWDVVKGTTESTFDPGRGVTRAQMSTFIAELIVRGGGSLASEPTDHFSDDDSSLHELNINRLADAGIVAGIGGGLYDPTGTVTREQMATFLVRAHEHVVGTSPEASVDYFYDDERSVHESSINAMASVGVMVGADGSEYRPQMLVTRAALAVFVARELDFMVEAGHTSPPAE